MVKRSRPTFKGRKRELHVTADQWRWKARESWRKSAHDSRRRWRESCGRACSKTISEEAACRIVRLSLFDARWQSVIVWRPVRTSSPPHLSRLRRPDAGRGEEQTRPVKCRVNMNWWDCAAGMPGWVHCRPICLFACMCECVNTTEMKL